MTEEIKVLDHGFVRYLNHMGCDGTVVSAARVSYRSESKGDEADKKLLLYLWKNRHTSPFEMLKISFNIKLPIFVMRQYVRHRMQNLNEVSARYTELPDEFYIPDKWRRPDPKNRQASNPDPDFNPTVPAMIGGEEISALRELGHHCARAYNLYQCLMEQGISREMARMVLPVNIYTEIVCCWDMKNLLHFISLRDDVHASWEIQQYAKAMKQICSELFPWTVEAFNRYKFELVEIL